MIKTIIFDFDGTIANTKAFAYQVYSNITNQYGIKQFTEEEFDHLKTLSLVDKFRVHDLSVFKLPKIARRVRRAISLVMHEIKPYEGMIELLNALKDADIQLFIVSSNSVKNIEVFTKQYQLDVFEKIYGRAKYLKKEKILKKLIKNYDLNLDETLYIGDETRDIVSCKRMDLPVASVTWGFDDKEVLKAENPDFLLENMENLKKLLIQA